MIRKPRPPNRRRERALSETPVQAKKRKTTGAADAIQGLTQSIANFGDTSI